MTLVNLGAATIRLLEKCGVNALVQGKRQNAVSAELDADRETVILYHEQRGH